MSLPSKTQVLVVGAGPCGLACAIALAELGVEVTIVDASATNKYGSRSAAVHARTLEVLNTINLAKPLIKSGLTCPGAIIRGGTTKLIELNVAQLHEETEFPMILFTPQHEVERIFRDRLAAEGVKIFREKTVVGLKEDVVRTGLDVTLEDGAVVSTRYVIGADGVRSTIRRLSGIDFEDPHTGAPYDGEIGPTIQIVLADIYLQEPLQAPIPRDALSTHIDKFLLLLPLLSQSDTHQHPENASLWRIAMGFTAGGPAFPRAPSREYLQQMLDESNPWKSKITIASVATSSSYRVRSAVAESFFKKLGEGNILLVGDAAHTHSPAGGQGMNLGICDAVALAHAIHAHMDPPGKDYSEDLDLPLREYSSSRRKIAIKVIGLTKGLNTLISASTGWRRVVRNVFLRVLSILPFVGRLMARRVSGLIYRDF